MLSQIVSLQELQRFSRSIRGSNGTVVLTNGCFDLLHVGHLRYLEAARSLGDTLVVAINDDASVRAIKGNGRPITPQAERAEMVAALETVDRVTIFTSETAHGVIESVRPQVYVKGGDYSADPGSMHFPPEGELVLSYGGKVAVVPYIEGHSTSRLVREIESLPRYGA